MVYLLSLNILLNIFFHVFVLSSPWELFGFALLWTSSYCSGVHQITYRRSQVSHWLLEMPKPWYEINSHCCEVLKPKAWVWILEHYHRWKLSQQFYFLCSVQLVMFTWEGASTRSTDIHKPYKRKYSVNINGCCTTNVMGFAWFSFNIIYSRDWAFGTVMRITW